MVIVSSFKLERNTETGIYTIISLVTLGCPLCNGFLKQRDRKSRDVKNLLGEIRHFQLRRLLCIECERLHTELPDIIQPFKHYDSETIQSVIDGDNAAKDCVADESTMRRWKKDFAQALPEIDMRLASVYARETDSKVPIISSRTTFDAARAADKRWLGFVMELLINNGHKLCTRFAFRPYHFSDKLQNAGRNDSGGGITIDKTFNDTG